MAPLQPAGRIAGTNRRFLERPTMIGHPPILPPLYTTTVASNCPSDFDYDLDSDCTTSPQSIRALYAQSFYDRSASSYARPARRMRKNLKEMTGFGTTDEEFEALPIAVRKKYFSTLERLSYAQDSRLKVAHELPIQSHRKSSLADRRGVNVNIIDPGRLPTHRQQMNSRRQSAASLEESWFLNLPNSVKNKHPLPRKKQTLLASRSRESLILTDDDEEEEEALNRAMMRQGRSFSPMSGLSLSGTPRESTDSVRPNTPGKPTSNMASQMYESFRWMDEEQDLDLKLALDDYHANLDGVVLPTTSSIRRPSFRRQMSVSKIPFGRNLISTLPESEPSPNHRHHRSRTMSLRQSKPPISKSSRVAIDPNAAHYQDPEARLKLRVYLASPKNFDEAIEFGFPSMDGLTDSAEEVNKPPVCKPTDAGRAEKSFGIERGQSFYNDDTVSSFEDDMSMADPDSPVTPRGELGFRPQNRTLTTPASRRCMILPDFTHPGSSRPALLKQAESFTHNNAGSREMTLRMTLTRPDLRADEMAIYGWQQCKSRIPEEPSRSLDEKSPLQSSLGYADGWGSAEKETGVVKRFWKKVKSSQRKAT